METECMLDLRLMVSETSEQVEWRFQKIIQLKKLLNTLVKKKKKLLNIGVTEVNAN